MPGTTTTIPAGGYDPSRSLKTAGGTIKSTSEYLESPFWKELKDDCLSSGLEVEGHLTQVLQCIGGSVIHSVDVGHYTEFDLTWAHLVEDYTDLEVIKSLREAYNQAKPPAAASKPDKRPRAATQK